MDEMQSFYTQMRSILKTYPRHRKGKIIQQGGFSILHDCSHKWMLPPQKVYDLLVTAERYWKNN